MSSLISAFTKRESCTLVISFFSSSTREQTASGGWLVNFTQISLSQTTFPLFLRLSVQLRHSLAGGEAKWESFANFSFFHKAPPPLCCGGGEANTLLALHIVNTFQASCNLCSAGSKREWTYLMFLIRAQNRFGWRSSFVKSLKIDKMIFDPISFKRLWRLSSPRAESSRAVTGRRCPHSGVEEDFLAQRPGFITKTSIPDICHFFYTGKIFGE